MFAKLYETEKYGQIVVMLQGTDDNDPEIRFFCQPPELGVCSVACEYNDWDVAEQIFKDEVNQERAEEAAKLIFHFKE